MLLIRKKIIIAFCAMLFVRPVFSQSSPSALLDSAADLMYKENRIDLALEQYEQLGRLYPDHKPAFVWYQTGNCFLRMGDTAQAISNYLRAAHVTAKDDMLEHGFAQTYAIAKLADIFYSQKRFREALLYMELTKRELKPGKKVMTGSMEPTQQLEFEYRKAVCYYGLDKKDSVVICMAPFIFRPYDFYYLDSLEYNGMVDFFISALFEQYNKQEIRQSITEALGNITFTRKMEDEPGKIFKWITDDCRISFLNITINLDDGLAHAVEKREPVPLNMSKEMYVKDFIASPAYRIIMN